MSGSHPTVSQDILALASELKEKANALYRQKLFAEANDIYGSIIELYANNISVQLIRAIRCNRAACFIEFGEFQSAIVELDQVLGQTPRSDTVGISEQTDPIFHKAHFRKARCLSELGRGAEGLQELDIYRDLVHGEVDDAEPHLREEIRSLISKSSNKESTTSNTRPFYYAIHVFGQQAPISLECNAPAELFVPHPSTEAANGFLVNLVKEHDGFVKNSKPEGWACWKCSKLATTLSHTPAMYLHLPLEIGGPLVIDFVRPVCKRLGRCDTAEDRKVMDRELRALSRKYGFSHQTFLSGI